MIDNKRRLVRKMDSFLNREKNPVSAVVYAVDSIGRTALVRVGGGQSAIRLPILTQTSVDSLANKVASGDKPKVQIQNGYVLEQEAGGQTIGATSVSIIVSGIDIGALNSDFYNHIGNADAHHAAFVGLLDDSNTNVNPSGQKIKITGSNGITSANGGSGILNIGIDSSIARSSVLAIAGAGLTDGGSLAANFTFNVGQGDGITVSANAVAVDASVARTSVLAIAGNGLTDGGSLASNFTYNVGQGYGIVVGTNDVSLDVDINPTWTGNHTFMADMESSSIFPRLNDTYDLGAASALWRKIFASEFDTVLFSENTIQITGGYQLICKDQGTLAADVAVADTAIDFGKAMTPNDFVVMRVTSQVEYIQVGSLVSGFTYNVTRNLDGSGANAWVSGTPFAVYGYNGSGRIELNAYDTPRISIIKQGTSWNAWTEVLRMGDLNGNWGYATAKNGIAIGSYESNKFNITADEDGVIRIRNHTSDALVFSPSSSYIGSMLTFGLNGGFYIGTGTPSSPTRGLKMAYSGGFGVLEGYNGGTLQAAFNEFGEITWLGGAGKLNATGAQITIDSAFQNTLGFRFVNGSGALTGGIFGYQTAGPTLNNTQVYTVAPNVGATSQSELWAESSDGSVSALVQARVNGSVSRVLLSGNTIVTTGSSINLPNSILVANTSFPSMASDGVTIRSDLGYHGFWYSRSSAWSQIGVPSVSSFPGSPQTNHRVFHTGYRCYWMYTGSAWVQTSIPSWSGGWPSSPQDKMVVWRSDRNLKYFYNSSTSEWYTTEIFEAAFGAVRILDQYTTANTSTSDVVAFILAVNNKTYGIRIVDSHFTSIVGATNSGSHYWTYTVNYQANNGGTTTTLLTGNTSAIAINTATNHTITDQNIGQNSTAGRIAVLIRYTGTPTGLSFRGVVSYRLVG